MSLPAASVLLHKLSELDVKCIRKIFRVERQLRESSTTVDFAVTQLGLSDAVVELLSDGACNNGNTALHVAFLKYGTGFIFDSLLMIYLDETTRNVANRDGLSFLHMACTRPYVDTVRAILESGGVNVNCRVSQRSRSMFSGYSPLHFAVQFGQYEVAELLLKHNADIYVMDHNYSTPLHIALEQGNVQIIDLLLAHDRKRDNAMNMWGLSHLMVACVGNDAIAAKEYIQAVPEPSRNESINDTVDVGHIFVGYTPLRFAMEYNRSLTVQMLKDYGARIENKTSSTSPRRPVINDSSLFCESCQHGKFNICFECFVIVLNVLAFSMFLLLLVPTIIY